MIGEAERAPGIAEALDSMGHAQSAGLFHDGSAERMAEHFLGCCGGICDSACCSASRRCRKAEIEQRVRDVAQTFLAAYWTTG
ncbi:MAG TPA: TetR/AcrR family transcriptional regulator C-terminal domain-containing protein [Alphaproteobacteria bacterium]|nr:TetR/AcrR family transcriptional regulator C-terminal domain-containing protein [Alphaproteobacteria bacterium]